MRKPLDEGRLLSVVKEVLEDKASGRGKISGKENIEEPVFLRAYNKRLVNKLKNTMNESEQVRSFLDHIMEGIGDGVLVVGRDYRILAANSAASATK